MHTISDHMAKILENLAEMFPNSAYEEKLALLKTLNNSNEINHGEV